MYAFTVCTVPTVSSLVAIPLVLERLALVLARLALAAHEPAESLPLLSGSRACRFGQTRWSQALAA